MDRYNRESALNSLVLEDSDTVELYETMMRRFDSRKVSDRYKYGNYHTNAEAVVFSSWSYRKSFILCGLPGYEGRPSFCHQTLLCEACCKKAAARMYVRFQHAFHRASHWYALTYSFTSNVLLESATSSDYLSRFAQADTFIKYLKTNGLIQGAVAVKEVSINSLCGAAVFPHTHAVLNSDRSDLLQEDGSLHPALQAEASRNGLSIRLKRIQDEALFLYELKYPLKPVNLKALYQEELSHHPAETLNLGIDIILGRLTAYSKGKPRMVYYGNMDARSKTYFGTKMNRSSRRAPATKTKELNSSPVLPTMASESSTTPDPMSIPYPAPVLPPAKKKKPSVLPWLGAGAAALSGLDLALNKGRASSALVNGVKGLFQGAPPSPRPRPVTLPLPRSQADVFADAAADNIGSEITPGARTAWQSWLKLRKGVAAEGAFAGVPGQPTVVPISERYDPRMMQNPKDVASVIAHSLQSNDVSPSAQFADRTLESMRNTSMLLGLGPLAGMGMSGASYVLPSSKALVDASSKVNKFFGGPTGRGLGATLGASQGYRLGSNPLTVEYFMDKFPSLSPEQAAVLSKTTMGTVTGLGSAVSPAAGAGVSFIENAMADKWVDQTRDAIGDVTELGDMSDLMARWYRGSRAGNPAHREALRKALEYIDSNKEFSNRIYDQVEPKSRFWHLDSSKDGAPALQSLIAKARNVIM